LTFIFAAAFMELVGRDH